jgi:hypothetical protein
MKTNIDIDFILSPPSARLAPAAARAALAIVISLISLDGAAWAQGSPEGGTAAGAPVAPPPPAPSSGSVAASAPAAQGGPAISLAPEEPVSVIARPAELRLPREQQIEVSLNKPALQGTGIGGYGELVLNVPSNAPAVVDMRRMVVYLGHNFNDRIRLYSEIEIEHAVSSASDKGEVEVEQAFLDFMGWRPLNFRAGILIMPVGIINVYHEPSTFNGVDRPDTDTLIIPSTWREPGAGVFGAWRWLRYQVYAVNGFNATGFSPDTGLREGHQEAQLAFGHDWGVVGRLDFEPVLGANFGASFYYANADQGQPQFLGNHISVTIAEADARWRWRGLEARAELASVWIGNAGLLSDVQRAAGGPLGPFPGPVADQMLGGYVEVGYNVLQPVHPRWGTMVVPFARYEHTDTQFDVPAPYTRALGNRRDTITAGVTVRPIAEVAVKLDYQRRYTDAAVDSTIDQFNVGLAFLF